MVLQICSFKYLQPRAYQPTQPLCALYEHTPKGFSDNQEKASENQTLPNHSLFASKGRAWSEFRATKWGK